MSSSTVNQSLSQDVVPPADSRAAIRFGLAVLLFGFGGFLLWASLAPLDEGVPVPGVVAVETYRKTVQHLTGGVVQEIKVREGDSVQAGQPLLIFDMTVQRQQQAVIGSQLVGLQAQVLGLQKRLPQREKQMDSLRVQATSLEPLVEEELYPRNQFAELQRDMARMRSEVLTERANLSQAHAQIAELKDRRQLLQTEIDRAVVIAPVAGTVFGLSIHTVGGVVAPGGKILELVPEGDTLIINAQVPTHLIEMVRAGLPAQLRFIALNPRRTPVVDGRVALVSADRMTDEQTRQSYYSAKVTVSESGLAELGSSIITPGMPVEVVVITGERTFFDYLAKPLLDSFAGGLKER
ncbi:MAG TPA: HlyD family efflux transporter periplasmic adaptor subunit [Solimonas sp.]|nr:HlyD family efflux transporter periplasmic adaptor subunit [Solimonas sp.]